MSQFTENSQPYPGYFVVPDFTFEPGRKAPKEVPSGVMMITAAGRSMMPEYPDRARVVVAFIGDAEPEVGKDYVVFRAAQGTVLATFKRLVDVDGEAFTLMPANLREFPSMLVVERAEALGFAEVVLVLEPASPPVCLGIENDKLTADN